MTIPKSQVAPQLVRYTATEPRPVEISRIEVSVFPSVGCDLCGAESLSAPDRKRDEDEKKRDSGSDNPRPGS
jgi:hypothetical protein